MKLSNEAKVGGLVAITSILAFLFAWMIGVSNPLSSTVRFYVTYNFAGGIDVGSPVRVAGIKVGKVEKIEFFAPTSTQPVSLKDPGTEKFENSMNSSPEGEKALTPLRLRISVQKEAMPGVRKDSNFYINLAGMIGERYIEITPGKVSSPQIANGDVVAGVDPPRIDQLISQSFNLAGTIKEIIDENKGDLSRSIELLYKLSGNLNQTLAWVDKSAIFKTDLNKLVSNLIAITGSVKKITDQTQTPEGEKTLKLLYDLLWRLEPLDKEAIEKFFLKEGVKVQFF